MVGKGGVGKSTVAAAQAVAAAEDGDRVLAVSLDQAHSLYDVFGCDGSGAHAGAEMEIAFGGTGASSGAVAGKGGPDKGSADRGTLEVLELDTLALAEERWKALTRLMAIGGVDPQDGELFSDELTVVPGVQEMLGLAAVADRVAQRRWDRVVVDCGPTAETLRQFGLPTAVSSYLERMWPRHRRLGQPPTSGRMIAAVGLAEQVDALATRLSALLGDTARTSLRVVTSPEQVALAEARRAVTAFALLGLPPEAIVVNRVVGGFGTAGSADAAGAAGEHDDDSRRRERAADHNEALSSFLREVVDVPVVCLPFHAAEPIGPARLSVLAAELRTMPARTARGDAAPGGGGSASNRGGGSVTHESGTGPDSVYVLGLELPLVDPMHLTLGRVGDDLIIGAVGVRHRVRLAPVLRRCTVRDATVDDGRLQVRFTPDPEVWPL